MALERTEDPDVFIVERGDEHVVYTRVTDGARWRIDGICSQCGECEVGGNDDRVIWTDIPVGQPGACYRIEGAAGEGRLDNPVTPDMMTTCPSCSLSGEWL